MKRIQITPDVSGAKTKRFIVTNSAADVIERQHQFMGGFRRFNFAVEEDGIKGRNQYKAFVIYFGSTIMHRKSQIN